LNYTKEASVVWSTRFGAANGRLPALKLLMRSISVLPPGSPAKPAKTDQFQFRGLAGKMDLGQIAMIEQSVCKLADKPLPTSAREYLLWRILASGKTPTSESKWEKHQFTRMPEYLSHIYLAHDPPVPETLELHVDPEDPVNLGTQNYQHMGYPTGEFDRQHF
jgi:hypothetical protein